LYRIRQNRLNGREFMFAVNPRCAKESDLSAIGPDYIREKFPDLDFFYVGPSDDVRIRLRNRGQGAEIWWLPMLAVFVLLAAESVLAVRWAPKT
jgi:hypothetical protein